MTPTQQGLKHARRRNRFGYATDRNEKQLQAIACRKRAASGPMLRRRCVGCPGGRCCRWGSLLCVFLFGGVSRVCVFLSSLALLLCCLAVVAGLAAGVVRSVVSVGVCVFWSGVAGAGVVGSVVGCGACFSACGAVASSGVRALVACVRGAVVGVCWLGFCVAVSVGACGGSSVGGVAALVGAVLCGGGAAGSCGAVFGGLVAVVVAVGCVAARAVSGALWFCACLRFCGRAFFFG